MPLPHYRQSVRSKLTIRGDDCERLNQSLRHQKAVEGIAVIERKRCNANRMDRTYRKLDSLCISHSFRHEELYRIRKTKLADGHLNCDLPRTDGAHVDFIVVISNRRLRSRRKQSLIQHHAKENVRIKQ